MNSVVWSQNTVGLENEYSFPCPRAGHTLVQHPDENKSILFGGASHEKGLLNCTFLLDNSNYSLTSNNDMDKS
jgi:hypothetical protein